MKTRINYNSWTHSYYGEVLCYKSCKRQHWVKVTKEYFFKIFANITLKKWIKLNTRGF